MKPGAGRRPFLGLAALTLVVSAAMAQTSFILRNGDVDKSGEVNDSDLTNVILDYSSSGPFPTANGWTDLTGDGLVDDGDLTAVILGYGEITVTLSGTPASPEGDFLLRADIELGEYFGIARFPVHLRARNLITDTLYSYDSPSVPDTTDPWLGSTAATYEMQLPEVGDYDVQVYVTDSTLTTPNRWSTWIGKVVHTLGPSENTIAAGTGPEKATIYWAGVPNAVGYNLYRAAASGGELVKVNASPITSLDPGPGLTNAYRYTDTGRATDEEAFYRVTAVDAQGVEGIYSEEVAAIPETNSIPWDTGDAAQILSALRATLTAAQSQVELWNGGDIGELTAMGPNGIIYQDVQGASPAAYARVGYVDRANSAMIDRTWPVAEEFAMSRAARRETAFVSCNPNVGWPRNDTGIWRKAQTIAGYRGLETPIFLPNTSPPNSHISSRVPAGDSAYIYAGGGVYGPRANPKEPPEPSVEVGFQLSWENQPGWTTYVATTDVQNPEVERYGRMPDGKLLRRAGGEKYLVWPGWHLLSYKNPSYAGIPDQIVTFSVKGLCGVYMVVPYALPFEPSFILQGVIPSFTMVAFVRGWHHNAYYYVIRANSIAQYARIVRVDPDHLGYVPTGAYVEGAAWGDPTHASPYEDSFGSELYLHLYGCCDWGLCETLQWGAFPHGNGNTGPVRWQYNQPFMEEHNIRLRAE